MPRVQFRASTIAFAAAFVVACVPATAGVIEQLGENASSQVEANEPIGQTFTADGDPNLVRIGFGFFNANGLLVNSLTTVRLYQGVGDGGSLLATVTETLPDIVNNATTFYEFDFSGEGVVLSPGQVYTALIYRPNARWSLERNNPAESPFAPDYAGGDLVRLGAVDTTQDARFRVVTVPEPASATLLAVAGCCLARRLRRSDRPTAARAA